MFSKYLKPVIPLLTALTIICLVVSGGCSDGELIEIKLPPQDSSGVERIYIGGAVNTPGYYSLLEGDTLNDLIIAAGGITNNGNADIIELYIPYLDGDQESQKIDLNRAQSWLLQALPGIGPSKAQNIIDYRNQNGPFNNTLEITRVEGIGMATYEQIKHLIMVSD